MPDLHVVLAHYPVINKGGDIIASAITNLDLHDISRAVKTFGARSFYVVTPLRDQQVLARKIIDHWIEGTGATYNPARGRALETIKVADTIADVIEDIQAEQKRQPKTIVTSARSYPSSIGYTELRTILKNGLPHLLILGTAWGLANQCISEADYVLEPIDEKSGYNHLSVRTAAGVILDRLLGSK